MVVLPLSYRFHICSLILMMYLITSSLHCFIYFFLSHLSFLIVLVFVFCLISSLSLFCIFPLIFCLINFFHADFLSFSAAFISYFVFCFSVLFLSIRLFFHDHSRITGLQGKGEGVSVTPHYHFHPLHRHLDINWAITAEKSTLHIGSSRTQTGNL